MADERDDRGCCLFCGSENVIRIGRCKFCGLTVCEHCGNFQHSMGQRFSAHDSCLKRNDTGFSMIRFVK